MRANSTTRQAAWSLGLVLGLGTFVAIANADEARDLKNAPNNTEAERLLIDAQRAENSGDSARYFALLRRAVEIAPNYEPARWALGQVKTDDDWLAVEEAQRRAEADPKQHEYRQLKEAYGESADGQLSLARWCQKNGLQDEARFHWATVVRIDPANREALRALGVQWHAGQLMTREQIAQYKESARKQKEAVDEWSSKIKRWRRAIVSSEPAKRDAAKQELSELSDISAIPAIEAVTLGPDSTRKSTAEECRVIAEAFIDALANMKSELAGESLVRHAVFAPASDVRESAADALKSRPRQEFVPLLLSGLAMPLESSFQVRTEPDGSVHYWHSLYREGAEQDFALDTRFAAMQNDIGGRSFTRIIGTDVVEIGAPTGSEPGSIMQKATVASRSQGRFGRAATGTELQVAQANQLTEALNVRIIAVLERATGESIGNVPRDWWDWWREQNEYYTPEERTVEKRYLARTESYYYGQPRYGSRLPRAPGPASGTTTRWVRPPEIGNIRTNAQGRGSNNCECFPAGTMVWTKVGHRPVEDVAIGDLVLSQNVQTGELCYKPVIGLVNRPPTTILRLVLDTVELRASAGHPLWVSGVGWRMAKEIEEGAILHGVTGAPRVTSVAASDEEQAFNLVVADFNTYFVGESGVLVHDNTPRVGETLTEIGFAAK